MPRGDRVKKTEGGEEAAAVPSKRPTPRARARKPAKKEEQPAPKPKEVMRLLKKYRQEVAPALVKEFGYKNPMQTPRLRKVVLNIGLGEAMLNPKALESAQGDMTLISGQRPVVTRARKSIAGFKLRAGMPIGLMVTLRGSRMYEFLDRLVNAALPRIRDFRGIPRTSVDGRGNFSMGVREQTIFPEIDYNQIDRFRGLQITITTTAETDQECIRLLELMGMPFSRLPEAAAGTA